MMQVNPFRIGDNDAVLRQYNTLADAVIDALALVPDADLVLISQAVGREISAETYQTILNSMADAWDATTHRQQLANDTPSRYHALSSRLLNALTNRLPAAELQLIALAQQWGNLLLNEDPDKFQQLVKQLNAIPLNSAFGQQLRAYFQAALAVRSAEFKAALNLLNQLLTAANVNPYVRARSLNARAVCQRVLGNPEAAMADYDACLTIWRSLNDRHYEAVTLKNIAILANSSLQQPQRCIDALEQAATIFEELNDASWLAAVHNNLGIVHHDLGNWRKALDFLQLAVERHRFEGASAQVAASLLNIGEIQLYRGEVAAAQTSFNEALGNLTNRLYQVDVHVGLGLVKQAQGKLAAALEQYETALAIGVEIGRNEILPLIHYRLADVHKRLGNLQAAQANLHKAITIIESSRTPLRAEAIKISLLGRWQQVYEALILLCFETDQPEAAFLWSERARARAFAEEIDGAADPMRLNDLQQLLSPQDRVLSYFTTGVIERDIPRLKSLVKDNPLREHLLTPPHIIRFDITSGSFNATTCPLDPNALTSSSARVVDGQRFLAESIAQHLKATLLPAASGQSQHVVIPHGPLHLVPFAALVAGVLVQSPSAAIFAQKRRTAAAAGASSALTVAFNGSGQRGAVLRYAEREAALVCEQLRGVVWKEHTSLQDSCVNKRFLHFACHGWFNHEQPMASYLEIAAAQTLTAQAIADEWRLSAELVTLSACQTGISQILRSDEPMGLVRAFLSAGARNVLVTQWSIEDLPTFLFMREFYSRIQGATGTNLAVVLRKVQEWLRKLDSAELQTVCSSLGITPDPQHLATPTPFANPKHWAAFTLIGA